MSTISWTVPPDPLCSRMAPSAPTGTTARLGTVWFLTKFRLDTSGRALPSAKADTHPGAVGSVAVTLATTADTPVAGTPARPATCRTRSAPAATGATAAPLPVRVSSTRAGDTVANAPGAPGAPSARVAVFAGA